MSMEKALLQQKIEFLEMEIEEARRREENLKKVNNSLMQALSNEPTILKDQTMVELQKTNDQNAFELNSLKKKYKEEVTALDKQIQDLFLAKKELQIDLKHQKTANESEKYELLSIIKQLETEKLALEKTLTKQQEDEPRFDAALTEKNRMERFRVSIEKNLGESRRSINKENDTLKGKLEILSTKLRNKKEKIKKLKEKTIEKSLRMKLEELEEELETYKIICKKQVPISKQQETEKALKKELDDAYYAIERLRKSGNDKSTNELKCMITRKDAEIKELREKLNSMNSDIEKLTAELNKSTLKLQQNEIYWAMSDEKRSEIELALKNEIKFLIGKLLKAKSKIGAENDCNETTKSSMITTVRSKSVKKPLKSNKMISPLDLSAITRSDSPFCLSHIDI